MSEILSHPIPAVIFLLGILILVHELGHYLVGIYFKVGVETFSIGFGPKMFGFRIGDTDFRVSWLPLGGYVKFVGAVPNEEIPERFRGREMFNTAVWKRFLIVAAGPIANFLLAILVFSILGASGIKHASSVVGQVRADGPAGQAGVRSGDKVVEINGVKILKWDDLQSVISKSPDKEINLIVERNSELLKFNVKPEIIMAKDFLDKDVKQGRIGIGYGFTPSIVSITDANGAFFKAGIKTGDKIIELHYQGKKIKTETWPQVQEGLFQIFNAEEHASSFQILVERAKQQMTFSVVIPEEEKFHATELTASSYIKVYQEIQKKLGISDGQLTIDVVQPELANVLKIQDRILSFEQKEIKDIYHLQEMLIQNKKSEVQVVVFRDAAPLELKINLKGVEVQKAAGAETLYMLPVGFMGASVQPEPYLEKYNDIVSIINYGISHTIEITQKLLSGVVDLFTGNLPLKSLGGPMMIAKFAGDSAKLGWQTFLTTMAIISINLGVVNLLPIPALDGGHIVMLILEKIKRRALSDEAIENYQKIGFVMVVALMILATYNDLSRFWKTMLASISGVF